MAHSTIARGTRARALALVCTLSFALATGATHARTIESGLGHTLAITPTGEVWAWGFNDHGQLGRGNTINSSVPVRSGSLSGVIAVAAGGASSVALRSDSTVWTWGRGNTLGVVSPPQLCTLPDTFNAPVLQWPCSRTPIQVPGLSGITAIAVGSTHVLALRSDGTLVAWGSNMSGQLGIGASPDACLNPGDLVTHPCAKTPRPVPGLDSVVAIAAGESFSLALRIDGTVWAWGGNGFGELGNGGGQALTPVAVPGLGGVTAIVAGARHALALRSDQSVWAWGSGREGQLGDGAGVLRATPIAVPGMAGAAKIAAGFNHSIVVKADGAFWAFGMNNAAQLGIAASGETCTRGVFTTFCRRSPVRVAAHDGAASVIGGGAFTVTLRAGGAIVAFGDNGAGQLGTGGIASGAVSRYSYDPLAGFSAGTGGSGGSLGTPSSTVGLNLGSLDGGLAFTSTAVGVPSASREVRFTNLQETAITIFTVTTSGNFSQTNNCPGSLPDSITSPTGYYCSIFVTFTPSGTGERVGTLTVTTNHPEAPSVTLPMSGTTPGITYQLSAATIGTGAGTVSSTPGGISCGPTCALAFASGTPVTLTAAPQAGSTFAGWSGACTGTGGCSVVMNAAQSVTAAFNATAPASAPSANPQLVDFGGQSMNTTSPARAVTIANTTGAPINVSSVTASTWFLVSHNCGVLLVGGSCTANVAFKPEAQGTITGSLSVTANTGTRTIALAGLGERSLVTHYYASILRRAPDSGGKAFWEAEAVRLAALGANVNETWFAMAQQFLFSAEYASFNRDNNGFVGDLYVTFFNRAADPGGLSFWVGQIGAGVPREVILASFMFSAEFAAFTTEIFGPAAARAESNTVMDFYRGLLARLPDNGGYGHWVQLFRIAQCQGAGPVYQQVESISSQFALSGEYLGKNRNNAQYVGDLYNAFLRRGGDATGVQFWIGRLAIAALTREQVRQNFLASAEFTARVNAIVAQGCL